jgi:hypothetical protein
MLKKSKLIKLLTTTTAATGIAAVSSVSILMDEQSNDISLTKTPLTTVFSATGLTFGQVYSAPTISSIQTFLSGAAQDQYKHVVNDVDITLPQTPSVGNNTVVVTAKSTSFEFAGTINVTYTLVGKANLTSVLSSDQSRQLTSDTTT